MTDTSLNITNILDQLVDNINLDQQTMSAVMHAVMTGQVTEVMLASILTALRMKGETIDEITGAAQAMHALSLKVDVHDVPYLVDIVGTGGDGQHLFNVSTASSFVVAAAGGNVAKHGNRGVSSSSGSSDLLEQAGIALDLDLEQTRNCIKNEGIGFLYAPNHHKSMKYAIGVRKELKMRSIFNVLGPLTNPAGVKNLLVGVFKKDLCEPLAQVYKNLGAEHVMVVHSQDGLDEISLAQPTFVAELYKGTVKTYTVRPEDVNLKTQDLEGLQVESNKESLAIIQGAFSENKQTQTFVEQHVAEKAADMIAFNAGAALYVAGMTDGLKQGVELAQKTLSEGEALVKLKSLAEYTKNLKQL